MYKMLLKKKAFRFDEPHKADQRGRSYFVSPIYTSTSKMSIANGLTVGILSDISTRTRNVRYAVAYVAMSSNASIGIISSRREAQLCVKKCTNIPFFTQSHQIRRVR